jgi:endonuclease YncB( thermonuclease family)
MGCIKSKIIHSRLNKVTYNDCKPYIPDIQYGKVIKVYDGDTITVACILKNDKTVYRFPVRLNGIDCPELNSRDIDEKHVAIIAQDILSNLVMNKFVKLLNVKHDKYGRILADVYINKTNLSEFMLSKRLAVPYYGKKKKQVNWMSYYYNEV